MKKRYAIVGTGGRSVMFLDAITTTFASECELTGICDISPTRMHWHIGRLAAKYSVPAVPTYEAADFDRMIKETKPDIVIVCTVDHTHHTYIVRAMELGCDVISEKPMTTDSEKAQAILDAVERTGQNLRVTFNYRYIPAVSKLREIIAAGTIGRPLAVDFCWMLDTKHGADYFRRWHREKDKSGGLLVHKATHHFDLVNWWINSYPKTVFAQGSLSFYGRENAEQRGNTPSYERYTGSTEAENDPFALFLDRSRGDDDIYSGQTLRGLYLNAEADSGYVRDRNVFGGDISIEDTMSVLARYENGAQMTYSLLAYSPWEGFRVAITGDKGRVELYDKHGSHIIAGQDADALATEQARGHEQKLRVFPMFGIPYDIDVPVGVGPHGGGDKVMLEQLFSSSAPADPLKRAASHLDGAASILVGISANESIRTGQLVRCAELLPLSARSED